MIGKAPGTQSHSHATIGSAHVRSNLPNSRDLGNLPASPVMTKKSVSSEGNIRADGCHASSRPTGWAPANPTEGFSSMYCTASASAPARRKASEFRSTGYRPRTTSSATLLAEAKPRFTSLRKSRTCGNSRSIISGEAIGRVVIDDPSLYAQPRRFPLHRLQAFAQHIARIERDDHNRDVKGIGRNIVTRVEDGHGPRGFYDGSRFRK